ncbi:MAG TPA: hypothetical protein VGM92_06995, partial [Candidatus Kapabacteria bacterium]
MRSFVFSVILILLLGQIPVHAQADSAQWPFPNAIGFNCQLRGEYTYVLYEKPNIDSESTTLENHSLPEWETGGPPFFTRNNVLKVDSNEWQLLNQSSATPATLDLFLDTINHLIQ